ncbi:MAG: hypothetical protein ACI9O4_000507 [Chitinophagales bacterium]|jgi:hypothetical protein
MKQNYTSILTKFFLVFFILSITLNAYAGAWNSGKFNISYNDCNHEMTIYTIVSEEGSTECYSLNPLSPCFGGCLQTDRMDYYNLEYKENGNWIMFFSYTNGGTTGLLPGGNFGSHNISNGVQTVTIWSLPNSLFGQDVEIRCKGRWREGGCGTDSESMVNETKQETAYGVEAASSLQVSTTKCSEIDLTWTNPDIESQCPSSAWNAYVYRKLPGATIYTEIADVEKEHEYTDNASLLAQYHGQDIMYQIKVTRFPRPGYNIKDTKWSVESSGHTIGYPSAVNSIQASTGRCDNIVAITWDAGASAPASYKLEKRESPSGSWTTLVDSLPPSPQLYEDATVSELVEYEYRIYPRNVCGRLGDLTTTVASGSVNGPPGKVTAINAEVLQGIGVQLTWYPSFNTERYQIERAQFGGGGSLNFDMEVLGANQTVPNIDYWTVADSVRTIDESLNECQPYEYFIRSFNDCDLVGNRSNSNTEAMLIPDLSNSFVDGNLTSSKGYYSDRVEVSWQVDQNDNFIEYFKIYRKIAGSLDDSIVLITLSNGSNIHNDFLALAGVLYEYTIVAESPCNQGTIYSNAVSSIGFRTTFGTVSGQVSYTGGVAVKNIKIEGNSSSGTTGNALNFNGSSSLSIPHANSLNTNNGLTLELWFKPSSNAPNYTLAEKAGAFSLKHIGNNYTFSVTAAGISESISIPDAYVSLNNYNHFTATLDSDTLRLFLNGNSLGASFIPGTGLVSSVNPLTIGNGFQGKIDEFRYFTRGKNAATVSQDFSRQLVGVETDLKVYLKMNEGTADFAYDFSRVGVTNFNKNHAAFVGSPSWTADIPSSAQLSIAAYTDAQGNYVLNIPYSGNGETVVMTPSYLVHNFSPSTRALFIGEGSAVFNNIDFSDVSSFTVQGSLFYANTSCAVAGATLKIDGNPVISNGTIATTDAQGSFLIQVPIGLHSITIEKTGHFMNIGRFPASGTYDFQNDLAGISFKDSSYLKVVGRVVGGLKEASFIPGLGKSKNNIGTAQIILKSQQGNGCFVDTVLTNPTTGEFTVFMPPMRFIPTVNIPSNPAINFGVLNLIDLTDKTDILTQYDTLLGGGLDSINYNMQLDYIHRVIPQIVVKDKDGVSDFIGDTTYTYIHRNGDTLTRDLKSNPLDWPVFNAIGKEAWYTCLITAFEEYENLQTNKLDTVPTTDGRLEISNNLCVVDSGGLEFADINTLDSLMYLYYSFKLGAPNFNENANIPQYSFVKTFEINAILPNGSSIAWKPANFNGIPSGQFAAVYDEIFRAYVLGTRSNGQQFITAGPQIPEYVLRDPPGSNSTSSREVGSTKNIENNYSWQMGTNVGTEDVIYVGTKTQQGAPGATTEADVKNNVIAGFSANVSGGNSGSESVSTTNTQLWATNGGNSVGGSDLPGRGSDLFIGKSKNITFGVSETLKIVPDSICNSVECLGSSFGNNLSMSKFNGLSIIPGGYETQFIYNSNEISNYLIPDLINLRDALLQTNPKYISNLANTDPNYGKNNDDPVFNPTITQISSDEKIEYMMHLGDSTYSNILPISISQLTLRTSSSAQKAKWAALDDLTNPDFSVLSGLSYTYFAATAQDSLTGDSVRWINNQIQQWEDALMLNEWEVVNISNSALKQKLKQVEITKLVKKYRLSLQLMEQFISIGGLYSGASGLASILIPLPGAAFVGYASFGITTGVGVAIAEVYDEVLRYQNELTLINTKYNQSPANYSYSGGNVFTSSITHESASGFTRSIEYGMDVDLAYETAGKFNNTGVGFKKSISLSFESGRDWSTTTGTSEQISFTLDDPDQGDLFSVNVYPSLLGWGPIFKRQPGGRTACPHEDAILTEYYLDVPANSGTNPDYPSFEMSPRTLQIDKPTMSVAPSLLTNIPITNSAAFNLTINNESEANFGATFSIICLSSSNPFGAIVKIDGQSNIEDVTINPGSSVNKLLTVEKGPGPVYNYDSLLILVYAPCQFEFGTSDEEDIVDSVYVSAHFLPTCTDVNFATPDDQWVLNNFLNDTLPIAVIDYDVNFFDFNSIRLDYKSSSQSQWTGLQTFYKDTAGLNNPSAELIPSTNSFTLWDWETDQVVDGDYDLRLVSQCTLVDKISPTHAGLMDRINPHPFGTPSPADGILDPSEDILIRFNEPIDLGSLTSLNFDLRGVINGSETTHSSNLYFDGINDYVEVTGGAPLQQRDFTIEFSVKRGTLGAEAIITQGPDGNEQIFIGFDSGNHLQCKVNGQSVNSLNTYVDNDWHYFAVSYNYANEEIEIFEASGTTTAAIVNVGSTSMFAKYAGADKMLIGKDAASGSHFTGNLDDVRIWNTARTLSEFSLTKSIRLGSNEPGLLYNWRFDEAEGIFAKDHVRSRDGIIYGAEWTVEPAGNALALDGVDDYLRIKKGDVNITQGMDFTLEFWFNSTQTGAASMVSTGKGDGIGADSLFAWNIAKDANGLIHVYHNGEDFVATNSNTFDGEWHHLALVLNRQGNLTSYLDGNLEASVQSTPYKDLGGPAFYLGARGYYTGSIEIIDNYFEGSIDEFRFWDASRKFEQIARDKNNRMQGDEYALRIYMPFEDYQLDPTGIAILTPSMDEQIDLTDTIYTVTNPNGALLSSITPKIKLQRPVESIAFTYSVNNDEIIITPTTNQALIENVTLDVTVKNVKDLNGNVMESPKTWIAYMDKNQVIWQDDLLVFSKDFGDNLSFSSSISNEGGAAKNFTIENLPDWLTITPTSGIIQPNSQLTVSFEVNPNVNIGDYSQDIHLLTDFGFPEKLTIDLKVREEAPNWTVNPADYTYSMSINGYLRIKDVVSASEEDILAVFVNDECRGVAHLQYVPQLDRYLAFLSVYSNVTNGEDLSFRIWDASTGTMFTEVSPSIIPFQENVVIGTATNPRLFETNYEITVDIPLVSGWNWIGHFLFNKDSTNLNLSLESLESETGDEIKTLTHGFSTYLDTPGFAVGWSGDINREGIRPELGYKIKVNKTDTLVMKGDILDPTSRTIKLNKGWNWIGFISIRNQNITQALGNHNPSDGDLIKSNTQFAIYYNSIGWLGDLDVMTPGSGYMYKSADTVDFVYPFAGMFKSGANLDENIYTNETWEVDNGNFASNMTAITKLNSDCEYLNDKQDLTLGIFDNTGNARAISPIEMHRESGLSFATIAGLNNEGLSIRILDNSTLEAYTLSQGIDYVSNAHIGSMTSPFELNISEEVCFKMQADAGVLTDYFKVYPTVIEELQYLDFISNVEEAVSKGFLYNIWGQKVWEADLDLEQGFNRVELNLNSLELAPGMYHFVLESNGNQQSVKLLRK